KIGLDTTGGRDSIGVGIRQATATQVQQIAISKYGFDPGTWQLPSLANPDRNVFFKLTGQVGKGLVELSYNYVNASNAIFARSSTINLTTLTTTPGASLSGTGYQLTQSGYALQNITNTVRAKWVNNFGKSSNE